MSYNPDHDLRATVDSIARAAGKIAAALTQATATATPEGDVRCQVCWQPGCMEPHPTPIAPVVTTVGWTSDPTGDAVAAVRATVDVARRDLVGTVELLDAILTDLDVTAPKLPDGDIALASALVHRAELVHRETWGQWSRRELGDHDTVGIVWRLKDAARSAWRLVDQLKHWLPAELENVPDSDRCRECGFRPVKYRGKGLCDTCNRRQLRTG